MPIYETFVIWTDDEGGKSVASVGAVYRDRQCDARSYAKDWADRVMKNSKFVSYETVVRQVLEQ